MLPIFLVDGFARYAVSIYANNTVQSIGAAGKV